MTEVLFTKMSSVYADDYENLELHFSEGTFVVAEFVCSLLKTEIMCDFETSNLNQSINQSICIKTYQTATELQKKLLPISFQIIRQ